MWNRIGVFDSGLGGLTVLRELIRLQVSREFIYLGDNARTPYGSKGAETVTRYAEECVDFLLGHEAEAIVIACNTASAFALETLRARYRVPICGAVEPACRAALAEAAPKILVLATKATVSTGVYTRNLRSIASSGLDAEPRIREFEIREVACPLFVPLVEEGLWAGQIVDQVVDHYLRESRLWAPDVAVLGCTHYPLMRDALAAYLGEGVKFVSSGEPMARELMAMRGESVAHAQPDSPAYSPSVKFFVTDTVTTFNRFATECLRDICPQEGSLEGGVVRAERVVL